MAYPGTGSPRDMAPKDGPESKLKCSPGSKCEEQEMLSITQAASKVGPAPTRRIYTRDYSKGQPDPDQTDLVTVALGNPFRL